MEPLKEINKELQSLYKDKSFDEVSNMDDIDKIKAAVLLKKDDPVKPIFLDEEKLRKKNFIPTAKAKERLSKLLNYIRLGIPVLLEGPTGTSKTLSVEIICEILEQEEVNKPEPERKKRQLKRFNLSQETKPQDLLGSYIGDQNSFAGIRMVDGEFIEAFREGYPLLLDEINLASKDVLQSIEEALDSRILSIEIPGKPLKEIHAHPDFTLIATQNPNKGLFSGKRKDLGLKFLSRFQIIEFPEIYEELDEIAEGLGIRFGYLKEVCNSKEEEEINNERKKIIKDFVNFHKEWKMKINEDDVQTFTIREIAAVMKALGDGMDPFETILIIYGARYRKEKKEEMIKVLRKPESYFEKLNLPKWEIPKDFPNCYPTKSLCEAISSLLFSFKNGRHAIISGMPGCGKTKLARWFSEYYGKIINKDHNIQNNDHNNYENYFCICTEEIKPSDLIGKLRPSDKKTIDEGGEILSWSDGILTESIMNGKILVLDSIEQAPSMVTERLNGLLDKKYSGEEKVFEIPENTNKKEIKINEHFRLLCTCNIDKINSMSPAFVNRFDIIVLEDQLNGLSDEQLKELIKILFKNSKEKIVKVSLEKINNKNYNDHDLDENFKNPINNINNENNVDEFGNPINDFNNIEQKNDNNVIEEEKNKIKQEIYLEEDKSEIYEPTGNMLEEIIKKYKEINKINKENTNKKELTINMYSLSQICRAIRIFAQKKIKEVTDQMLVDFCTTLILNNSLEINNINISDKIMNYLIDLSDDPDSDDNKFFYKDSESLSKFMAIIHAATLINLPLCIFGDPGVGKTAMIRAFGRIRADKYKISSKDGPFFQLHTFHNGTKASDFFGVTTFKENGKIEFTKGTLTNAIKYGYIFIADEMNVSPIQTMKSLSPALEPAIGETIYIPGIEQNIIIHNSFHFIACQNFLGTIGRNAIPDSIINRIRQLKFPSQSEKDIKKICTQMKKDFYASYMNPKFTDNEAALCGSYMIQFNRMKQKILPKLSFRDITKIFKRMVYQEENASNYWKINITHNLLFYTLSSISEVESKKRIFEKGKTLLDKILELIKLVFMDQFSLREDDIKDLKDCYFGKPMIRPIRDENGNSRYFLMKHKIGICLDLLITLFKKDKIISNITDLENIPSFSNDLFKVLLSNKEEPILLVGPTGYKTFLSRLILKDTIPVTVNQESTVEQLLGSTTFLTKIEAKLFYLKNICNICDSGNYEELEKKILNENPNDQITEDDINKLSEGKEIPFDYALKHLKNKLLNDEETNDTNSILTDMILEFRPGLILSAILKRSKLIIKNLSNLPTTVLERFNELFSGKHNLTINEDIHDTFTEKNKKELCNFSEYFRIFATCPNSSLSKLSEAVLSRFTVNRVETYSENEQEYVLKFYCKFKKLSVKEKDIKELIDFVAFCKDKKKIINLNQMISILYFTSLLNNKLEGNNDFNLSLILFRYSIGYHKSRIYEPDLLNYLFLSKGKKIDFENNGESPITEYKDKKGRITGIISKITNFKISTSHPLSSMKIAFTRNMIDMIDILHLGIFGKIPVIFEGENGFGKKTSIQYVAESLGLEIINIVLSQSTNTEQLLGKIQITKNDKNEIKIETIKTKLRKSLEHTKDSGKSIIVFHNLNNASAAVLELITSIFDYKQPTVLLPDGSKINKGPVNLVGLFNPQNGISNRDRLPHNLRNCSLYYILKNKNKEERAKDLTDIIEIKFKDSKYIDDDGNQKDFISDVETFTKRFTDSYKYLEEQNEKLLTYNDITKYIILRKAVKNKLDDKIISQFIFAYSLSDQKKLEKILEILSLNEAKFNPSFNHNIEKQELCIKLAKAAKDALILPVFKKFSAEEIEEIRSLLDSLTKPQKQCILCLAATFLAGRTSLIQGGTASGKTLIIRVFSKLMGKKLNIYQMNSETGVNIITGQPEISENLDDNEIELLLKNFEEINNITKKNLIETIDIPNLKRVDYNNIIILIDNEIKTGQISEENKNKLKAYKSSINKIISPASRFKTQKSTFIKSMEDGDWILLDGIESAPPQIAEKISSLCGDNPEIDLIECGPKFCYSLKEKEGYNKINKEFRIFITYNPSEGKNASIIEENLLTKCITFCLPPMDSKLDYSSQIFYSSLKKAGYNDFLSENLSPRLSNVHSFVLNDSINNTDKYCGNVQITGRKIIFVSKEFNDKNNLIEEQIVDGLRSTYYLGYNDSNNLKNFKDSIVSEFKKEVKPFKSNEFNIKNFHRHLLKELRDIQIFCLGNENKIEINFDFSKFIELCLDIRIDSLENINWHIKDTLKIIENDKNLSEINKSNFRQISIVSKLLEEIISKKTDISSKYLELLVKDPILLDTKEIKKPILKLKLLSKLVTKEQLFFTQNLELDMIEKIYSLSDKIKLLYQNQNILSFLNFVEELNKKTDEYYNIKYAKLLFPNNIFNETKFKLINFWVDLLIKLCENKNTTIIKIKEKEIKFLFPPNPRTLNVKLIFDRDDLLLKEESFILCRSTNIKFSLLKSDIIETFKLYRLICEFYTSMNITREKISKKIKDMNNKFELSSPYKSNYFNISNFFISKQEHTLIGMAWSLIYNIDSKLIEKINYLFLDCLKELIDINNDLFMGLNEDKAIEPIIGYTKSLSTFCGESSVLWRIINNNLIFNKDDELKINQIINDIKREKSSIENLGVKLEERFNKDKYLKILNTKLYELENILNGKEIDKNISKITEEFNQQIIENLRKIEFEDQNSKGLKMKLISHLNYIVSNEKIDENLLEYYKTFVNKFISTENSKKYIANENILNWSSININEVTKNYDSEEIKLYEQIIWYSKYYHIFKQIKPETPKETILNFIREIDNQKVQINGIKDYIWNCVYLPNSGFNRKTNKIINSTLNAYFIKTLLDSNLFKYINNLDQIINKLSKRENINNEIYNWGNDLAKSINIHFKLYLPKFNFSDMLFLFINYLSNDKITKGPSLDKIRSFDSSIDLLTKFIDIDFNSHKQCIDNVAGIIFNNVFDTHSQKTETDHKKLKELFEKKLSDLKQEKKKKEEEKEKIINNQKEIEQLSEEIYKNDENERLCKNVINCLISSEVLDNLEEYKLEYPELEQNSNKIKYDSWLTNKDFIEKYPTVIFWCYKFPYNFSQFPEFFGDEREIPFWFFIFRILSSPKCVTIDDNNLFSSFINKIISNLINDKLTKNKYPNLGTTWMNLLLNNVPENIFNNNLKILYSFICNICKDKKDLGENLNKIKKENIEEIIKQIYKYSFENRLLEILSTNSSKIVDFLYNPNYYIFKEIINEINSRFQKIQNDINIVECYNTIKDIIPNCKSDLITQAKSENQRLLEEFIEDKTIEEEVEIKKQIKIQKEKYLKYDDLFNKIKDNADSIKINIKNNGYNYLDIKDLISKISSNSDEHKKNSLISELNNNLVYDIDKFLLNSDNYSELTSIKIDSNKLNNSDKYSISSFNNYIKKNKKYYLVLKYEDKCIIYLFNSNNIKNFLIPTEIRVEFYNEIFQETKTIIQIGNQYSNNIYKIKEEYLENKFFEEMFQKQKEDNNNRIKENDSKHLLFGDKNLNIEDFIKELDNFVTRTKNIEEVLTKFQTYKINYDDKINSLKLFKDEFFYKIQNYEIVIYEFINQLIAKISKGDPRIPEINDKLNNIKTEFDKFKINLEEKFMGMIEKDIKLKELWDNLLNLENKEDIFLKDYSIPDIKNNYEFNFNFNEFNNNSDFLSLPILALDKNNNIIKCCYKELNYSFGSICPSLFKNKSINFNILSFIGKEVGLKINIDNKKLTYINDEKNGEDIIITQDINSLVNFQIFETTIKLFISIPQLKNESKIQKIKIECDLNFRGNKLNDNKIHCCFTANLIPLSIFISCEEYELAYDKDKNVYILDTHHLSPKETINFIIKYHSADLEPKFKLFLESFSSKNKEKENEAEKPELFFNPKGNKFSMGIPGCGDFQKIKRLKCSLTIYLTDKFFIKIIIDANIIPFDFSLACFDYYEKKYIYDDQKGKHPIIFVPKNILPLKINLVFKISLPIQIDEKNRKYYKCESKIESLKDNIENYLTIFDKKKVNTIFDLCDEIIIPLEINSKIYSNNYLTFNEIIFNVKIKDKKKNISLYLKSGGNFYGNRLLENYIKKEGEWRKENEEDLKDKMLKNKINLISYNNSIINGEKDVIIKYISFKGEFSYKEVECGFFGEDYNIPFLKIYKYNNFEYPDENLLNQLFESKYNLYRNQNDFVDKIREFSEEEKKNVIQYYKKLKGNYFGTKNINKNNYYTFFSVIKIILEKEKFFNQIKNMYKLEGDFSNNQNKLKMIDSLISFFKNKIKYIKDNSIKTTENYSNLSKQEIKYVQNIIKEDFYNLNNTKNIPYISSDNIKNLSKKIKESDIVEFIKIPEDINEAYIIKEDLTNTRAKRKEQLELLENSMIDITFEKAEDIEVELPDLEYPLKDITFDSFIIYLEKGIQASRVLPLFVKNSLKSKNKEKEEIAIKKFKLLVNIYNSVKKKKYSIFSEQIDNYILAFKSMLSKFFEAGIRINDIIREFKFEKNYRQDFIKYPEINADINKHFESKWEKKDLEEDEQEELERQQNYQELLNGLWDNNKNNIFKPGEIIKKRTTKLKEDDLKSLSNLSMEDKQNNTSPNYSSNISRTESKPQYEDLNEIKNEQINNKSTIDKSNLNNIIISMFNNIDNKQDILEEQDYNPDEQEINELNNNKEKEKEKINVVNINNEGNIIKENINPEDFESMIDGYSEKDAIEKFLVNISNYENLEKEGKELPKLDLGTNFQIYRPKPKYLDSIKNLKEGFFIEKLIDISKNLASKLYNHAASIDIPFSNLTANIIIDCTFFISNENKFYFMFLISALTCALNALEIPYLVSLISDENFKVIIKDYDNEMHSNKIIQRIFDCIFIPRYYTSLANGMKTAVDNFHFKSKEERPYRAFFIFSNGLDHQIYLFNEWKEKIFCSSATHLKDKFGFIFIKGHELDGENLEKVKIVWNNFENNNSDKIRICKILSENPILDYKNISNAFINMFSDILKFQIKEMNDNISKLEQKIEPIFNLFNLSDFELKDITPFEESIKSQQFDQGIYVSNSDVLSQANLNPPRLDSQYYNNKLNRISSVQIAPNITKNFMNFSSVFLENKAKLSPSSIETLFKPNYATQKVLSTQGSEFDITALILHLVNPLPNPRIYLEKKIMDKRRYAITIVIDSSYSCFNTFNFNHSFLTIRALLSSLLVHELPILDVIVSGVKEPYILVSNLNTSKALGKKSTLLDSLLAILQKPPFKSDLCMAIRAAYDLKRLRQEDFPSYLFVLTDGLFQKSEIVDIINIVNCCVQSGMDTFGIGLGIYPILINNLFPQVIYCKPNDIIKGISSFLGDNISKRDDQIIPLEVNEYNYNELNSLKYELLKKIDSPVFEDLKLKLKNLRVGIDAIHFLYNPEQVNNTQNLKGYKNPFGKGTEMYKEGSLKGHKILITMFWTSDMSSKENPRVDPSFLLEKPSNDEFCLKDALDHYGVEAKVVLNYREAIEEITRVGKIQKDEKSTQYISCCEYYSVFVICGPPYKVFPEQEKKEDPELIGKFIDALIQFWKNEGSIVFLAEGTPLTFQVNTFLENCEFPGYGKVNFRIGGDFIGEKIITGDDTGNLELNGLFNRKLKFSSIKDVDDQQPIQRSSISHNLKYMYEGSTISYVTQKDNFDYNNKDAIKISDLDFIKPFQAFAKGSNGGIISLFYNDDYNKYGDIVIDTGFTKCFLNMKTESDSFRYFQNIIGWISRPEIHMILDKKSVILWRPKPVILENNVNSTYTFLPLPTPKIKERKEYFVEKMPTIIAMDCSGSIEEIKNLYFPKINDIVERYKDCPTLYYLWGSNYYLKSYEEIQNWIEDQNCPDGTNSIHVAQAAKNAGPDYWGHLIIVTDGKVDKDDITQCDNFLKENKIKFKYVSTYVIGKGGDFSVGAPFTRECANQTINILDNYQKVIFQLTENDLKILEKIETINNYEEFRNLYGKLTNSIIAKMLGKDADEELKIKLDELKNKIISSPIFQKKEIIKNKFISQWNKLYEIANGKISDTFSFESITAFQADEDQFNIDF